MSRAGTPATAGAGRPVGRLDASGRRARNPAPRAAPARRSALDPPRIATAVLGVAVVVQCGLLVRSLLGEATPSAPAPSPTAAAAPVTAGVDTILAAQLFGAAATVAAAATAAPPSMVLNGTLAATDPARGLAFLSVGGVQRLARPGDELGSGFAVAEVHSRHVVVAAANGGRSIVSLPGSELARAGSAPPAAVDGGPAPVGAAGLDTSAAVDGRTLAEVHQARVRAKIRERRRQLGLE